ncbi:hypothetical protein ACJIZ3_025306 [Penstemon smallii]|uniref:Uncharacterized protein n=1 Tax=Penstemon smallii TaxID=265156 RepID=A0ABD3TWT7_9LAMI
MGLWISRVHVAFRRIFCLLLNRIIWAVASFLFVHATWVPWYSFTVCNDFHSYAAASGLFFMLFYATQLLHGNGVNNIHGVVLHSADLGITVEKLF